MPFDEILRLLADLEGQTAVALLVSRALLQRLTHAQTDPHAFLAGVFDDLSSALDQIEEHETSGPYADMLRAARRRALDDLAGSLARDSRLDGTPK